MQCDPYMQKYIKDGKLCTIYIIFSIFFVHIIVFLFFRLFVLLILKLENDGMLFIFGKYLSDLIT